VLQGRLFHTLMTRSVKNSDLALWRYGVSGNTDLLSVYTLRDKINESHPNQIR